MSTSNTGLGDFGIKVVKFLVLKGWKNCSRLPESQCFRKKGRKIYVYKKYSRDCSSRSPPTGTLDADLIKLTISPLTNSKSQHTAYYYLTYTLSHTPQVVSYNEQNNEPKRNYLSIFSTSFSISRTDPLNLTSLLVSVVGCAAPVAPSCWEHPGTYCLNPEASSLSVNTSPASCDI